MNTPKKWIEKRVQWTRPRGACYPQPPDGHPYILFSACILPGYRDDALQLGDIPKGYGQYLMMCNPHRVAAPETVHKGRQTKFKNLVAKKTAGMLPLGRDLVESRLREKKDADYFDFETAVATQEFRKQMLAEIMADWAAELVESMEQLDEHPELRVRANCNSAAIRRAEGF